MSVSVQRPVLQPNGIVVLSWLLRMAGRETRSYISRLLGSRASSQGRMLRVTILEDSLRNLYPKEYHAPKFQSSCFVELELELSCCLRGSHELWSLIGMCRQAHRRMEGHNRDGAGWEYL